MFKFFFISLLALFVFLPATAQAQEQNPAPWQKRCQPDESGKASESCEIFQKLVANETGQRFLEFAVGEKDAEAGVTRGVIILPLGVLLEPGVKMKIDDGQLFKFNVRYCDQAGCVAFVSLNDDVVKMLKGGSQAIINFVGAAGQPFNIGISLQGFTAAYQQL